MDLLHYFKLPIFAKQIPDSYVVFCSCFCRSWSCSMFADVYGYLELFEVSAVNKSKEYYVGFDFLLS